MASIITATVASGLTQSADNSGVLQLASGTGNLVTIPSVTGTAMVSGNMPAFRAYLSSDQTVSSGVLTKCTLDVESFDTNNNFASNRFTPTVAGYYQIDCSMRFTSSSASMTNCLITIYKSGSEYSRVVQSNGVTITSNFAIAGSDIVYCNGTTDYIEMYGLVTGSGTVGFNAPASYVTCTMAGSLVRGA